MHPSNASQQSTAVSIINSNSKEQVGISESDSDYSNLAKTVASVGTGAFLAVLTVSILLLASRQVRKCRHAGQRLSRAQQLRQQRQLEIQQERLERRQRQAGQLGRTDGMSPAWQVRRLAMQQQPGVVDIIDDKSERSDQDDDGGGDNKESDRAKSVARKADDGGVYWRLDSGGEDSLVVVPQPPTPPPPATEQADCLLSLYTQLIETL